MGLSRLLLARVVHTCHRGGLASLPDCTLCSPLVPRLVLSHLCRAFSPASILPRAEARQRPGAGRGQPAVPPDGTPNSDLHACLLLYPQPGPILLTRWIHGCDRAPLRLNKYRGRYAEAESRYGPKPNMREAGGRLLA